MLGSRGTPVPPAGAGADEDTAAREDPEERTNLTIAPSERDGRSSREVVTARPWGLSSAELGFGSEFQFGRGRRRVDTLHIVVCDMIVCVPQVDRFSVTMAPELGGAVREAAARQGTSVSSWIASAAAQQLRNELLGAALDAWEAEDGAFSDAELDAASAAPAEKAPRRRGAA